MSEIVIVSGSPSESSRSDIVLRYLESLLKEEGFSVAYISIRDVPQDVLFHGTFDSPVIEEVVSLIKGAKGLIVGSPVYKAAYSGVLKSLLDLLPQDVLQGKPVLPLMTGGSQSHLLAIEYTLKPILATLKGQNLKGVYLVDGQIEKTEVANPIVHAESLSRLKKQLYYFTELLNKPKDAIL